MLKKALITTAALLLLWFGVTSFLPGYMEGQVNQVIPHERVTVSKEAAALHADLTIGDLHADSTLGPRNLAKRSESAHVDLPRLMDGNVALQMFTSVTKSPSGQNLESNPADNPDMITALAVMSRWPLRTWRSLTERSLYHAEKIHSLVEQYPERVMVVRTPADLETLLDKRAAGDGILGAVLGIEGAHALDRDLTNADRLFNAGFRMIGLHHFFDNALGGSLHGVRGGGLTEFGEQVVRQFDAMGIMIDVSHSSEETVRDVLRLTDRPLIVSHTGFKGYCDTPRNISDDLMLAVAAEGGLIGVGYWEAAICNVSVEGIVAGIRYGIDLVGADHVALGSDFDGAVLTPIDTSELDRLTEEMLNTGFSEIEIRKVMGGNMVRFLRENLPPS